MYRRDQCQPYSIAEFRLQREGDERFRLPFIESLEAAVDALGNAGTHPESGPGNHSTGDEEAESGLWISLSLMDGKQSELRYEVF
jgi:hypothetical protein